MLKRTYQSLGVELALPVAATSRELGSGRAPVRRVRVVAEDVTGLGATREEPDADPVGGDLRGVDAAANAVETFAVGIRVGSLNATAGVGVLAGGVHVAVGRLQIAREAVVIDGATIAGVEHHVVEGIVVDTLNDVNLPAVRPVTGAQGPAV